AEHRAGRARGHTRRVVALVAARDLECAARVRKLADVDVLDVRARDGERHLVLLLARGGARVAADAARLVDDLGPERGAAGGGRGRHGGNLWCGWERRNSGTSRTAGGGGGVRPGAA